MSIFAIKNDEGKYLHIPEAFCDHDWDTRADTWDDREVAKDVTHHHGGHVVELVEAPAKIVVSTEEAEMLEQAKCDDDPAELIVGFINSHDEYDDDRKAEDRLMRAYVNGYTVENEKKYNVKVPHTKDVWYCKSLDGNLRTICPEYKKLRGTFTEAEIEHYDLQDCEKVEVKK